jgi:hypothetical protein
VKRSAADPETAGDLERGEARPDEACTAAVAQMGGWLAAGLVNVAVGLVVLPSAPSGVSGRLVIHLYDLGQMLAVGLVAGVVVLAWGRWGPRRREVDHVVLGLLALLLGQLVLPTDLRGGARILGLEGWKLWSRLFAAAFSLCIPLAAWLGGWLGRGKRSLVALVAGLALAAGHQLVLPNLYPGIHTFGTWCAATLLASGLRPISARGVAMSRRRAPWVRRSAALAAVVLAAMALGVPPPTTVSSQLRMLPGAVVARYKPVPPPETEVGAMTADASDWYQSRAHHPPIAPSEPRLLGPDPLVILFVVDALRADVLTGPEAKDLPTMAALMRRGATFRRVWSPAPNTNPSVAALHAGEYPAQIHWKLEAVGKHPRLWPDDDSTRLGDVLATKRIASAAVVSRPMAGLAPRYGLTQGMRLEVDARNQHASTVVEAFLRWLRERPPGPLFAYLHVTDAHAPYNLAGKGGTKREGYIAELGLVDRALGDLLAGLRSQGLEDRTLVLLTADHGEAFGEHNSWYHGTTVYEEMMRVPLVVTGTGVAPRRIDEPVTTLDLGPTIIDLFGLATPGTFMGQSLVPLIRGDVARLDRPIFLDSHVGVSGMVFRDGLKLVVNKGVPELYDLHRDPRELDNVFDRHSQAAERLGTYRRFVAAHEMKFATP